MNQMDKRKRKIDMNLLKYIRYNMNLQLAVRNISKQELAKTVGVKYKTLCDYTNCRLLIPIDILVACAKVLNCEVGELLKESEIALKEYVYEKEE